MTLFEKTKTYQEILKHPSSKTIVIPFHIKTDILVSEQNVESLIKKEIDEYKEKINIVSQYAPDFPIDHDMENKIRSRITPFIGKTLLKVEYAYLNYSNLMQAITELENHHLFVEWLID